MKNFSEVTAINTADRLAVHVELIEHGCVYNFSVNQMPLIGSSNVFYLDLLSPISFKCNVHSGAIDIAKIAINGHEVMPLYQHHASPATAWVTADWELHIQQPFYTWYHQATGQGWIA